MVIINCDNCNKEINIKPRRIKLNNNNFCSNSCRFYFVKHNPSITASYKHLNYLKKIAKEGRKNGFINLHFKNV